MTQHNWYSDNFGHAEMRISQNYFRIRGEWSFIWILLNEIVHFLLKCIDNGALKVFKILLGKSFSNQQTYVGWLSTSHRYPRVWSWTDIDVQLNETRYIFSKLIMQASRIGWSFLCINNLVYFRTYSTCK